MTSLLALPPGFVPYAMAHELEVAYAPAKRWLVVRPFYWLGSWFLWLIPPTDADPRPFVLAKVPRRLVGTADPKIAESWGVSRFDATPNLDAVSAVVLVGGALSSYRWAFEAPMDDITHRDVFLIEVAVDCSDVLCDARVHTHVVAGDARASPVERLPRSPGGRAWDVDTRVYEGHTPDSVIHDVLARMATSYSV